MKKFDGIERSIDRSDRRERDAVNHEVLLHERTRNDGSAMRYDKSVVTKQHCKTPVANGRNFSTQPEDDINRVRSV